MSAYLENFINYLEKYVKDDKGAKAILKRSLGFDPGNYPPSYPYVEPFVADGAIIKDSQRKGLYLVAGLYAYHPSHKIDTSFASAFGSIIKKSKSESLEKRFIALLSADAEDLPNYLRQAISIISTHEIWFDYVRLSKDIFYWSRDNTKQQWARDFYCAYNFSKEEELTEPKK